MNPEIKTQVRAARRSFAAIAISYFMGLFNDNFYKEAALIIAVTLGNTGVQAAAAAIFTVSYMLAAAPGGWLADRFAKGHIIIASKAVEVAAMLIGAFGVWTGNWTLILTMLGIMAAQSAVFSPSMNGSIPELYPAEYVQTANTVVRVLSTTAIFTGMALAGRLMDMKDVAWRGIVQGPLLVGMFAIGAALAGFAVSFAAPRIPARGADAKFPWSGPRESVAELIKIRRDRLLTVCLYGNIYIWSVAAVITLLMVNMGIEQFRLSPSMTAGMKIVFLFGVAAGGLLSNVIAKGRRFFRVFIPAYFAMAFFLALIAFVPMAAPGRAAPIVTVALIALTGAAGGVILVPLESFIQIRPAPDRKGRVIAAANFAVFAGMTVGAGALYLLNKLFEPTTSLGVLGFATGGFSLWLRRRLGETEAEICDLR